MSQSTLYGRKRTGYTQFVIIAPHAAGDDLKTGIIASRLAKKIGGFLVLNNIFFKASNTKAKEFPGRVEDFNKLRWGVISKKYFWSRKKPEMKFFFKDIVSYCDQAKKISKENKAVAIYIHGMEGDKENRIDIGCGVKNYFNTTNLLGSIKHKVSGSNSGGVTLRIKYIKKLKILLLSGKWEDEHIKVTVGNIHPGWSRQSAIQFHKHRGRDDYAFQVELSKKLRSTNESINYVVQLLSQSLLEVFK